MLWTGDARPWRGAGPKAGGDAGRGRVESVERVSGISELAGEVVDVGGMLRLLRAGDQDAEKLLVQQLKADRAQGRADGLGLVMLTAAYTPIARAHLARKLPGLPADEREDAWHRALFEVWRRIDHYDAGKSRLRTWICRMAQWQSPRQRSVEAVSDAVPDMEPILDGLAERHDPVGGGHGVSPEQQERLYTALARLGDAERDLLEMRYQDQCTYHEIAERLGGSVSPDAVRVAVHRIIKRLREWMR